MRIQDLTPLTRREQLEEKIEDLILRGELSVGERLPSERELAEQMKMSKTAVHAAIDSMVRKGFLEVVPRQGIFVGDYAENGTLEALAVITQHNGGSLDPRNVQSLMEMRYAIESIAIELVIKRGDPEVIKNLRKMADEAVAAADAEKVDYTALGELYFRFHHYICVASGNTIAPLIINAFRNPSVSFWANSARALGLKESVGRLVAFADYIEAGDLTGVREHLKAITQTSAAIVRDTDRAAREKQ